MVTNNAINVATAASGTILQGAGVGTAPVFSTATYPSTAGTSSTILRSDGTNFVNSTPTFPNTATANTVLAGDGTNFTASATPTVTSISFGGTALSNYTEGTWTPTVIGNSTAGVTSYTTQVGYYVRIGNRVFCDGVIIITGASGTGSALFGALPFTVKNQANYFPRGTILVNGASWVFPTSTTYPIFTPNLNATTAFVNCAANGVASSALQMANAACTFTFSFSYQI